MNDAPRAPGAIIVDSDAEREMRIRTMPALRSLFPASVGWGPQVAPLVALVDPQVVIAGMSRNTERECSMLRAIRAGGYGRTIIAVVSPSSELRRTPLTDADHRATGAIVVREADLLHTLSTCPGLSVGSRSEDHDATGVLHLEDAIVDLARGEVIRRDQRTRLAPRERALLAALLRHRGAAVTRESLLEEVWGEPRPSSRVVDRQYLLLRRRLERDPRRPAHLRTTPQGYRLITERSE